MDRLRKGGFPPAIITVLAFIATASACISVAAPALSAPSGSYFFEIANNQIRRWPQKRFPLKVYIPSDADGAKITGYRPEFGKTLHDAFTAWQTASNGLVSFRFVDSPADADIDCRWSADQKSFANMCWCAQTQLDKPKSGNSDIDRAHITIMTTSESDFHQPAPFKRIHDVALHEVGHSLGLRGHSHSTADIMYPGKTQDLGLRRLSTGDVETLKRLYQPGAESLQDTVSRLIREGNELTKEGKFADAIRKFNSALRYERTATDAMEGKIKCLHEQSRQLLHDQQYTDALSILKTDYQLTIDDSLSPGTHLLVTRDLAAVYERLGKYPAAISKLHELAVEYKRQGKLSEAKAVESTISDLESRNK